MDLFSEGSSFRCEACQHSKEVRYEAKELKKAIPIGLYTCKLQPSYYYRAACNIGRFVPRQHK